MTRMPHRRGFLAAAALASLCSLGLAGCGTSNGGGSGTPDTLTEIDYYGSAPQNTQI